jgi:hypothetical protein
MKNYNDGKAMDKKTEVKTFEKNKCQTLKTLTSSVEMAS